MVMVAPMSAMVMSESDPMAEAESEPNRNAREWIDINPRGRGVNDGRLSVDNCGRGLLHYDGLWDGRSIGNCLHRDRRCRCRDWLARDHRSRNG
jgi:hypothetical protein